MNNELTALLKKRLEEGLPVTGATGGGGGDGALLDGASPTTKATVRASTVDGTKNGLVVVNPDGSNIGGGSGGGLTDTQLRATPVPVSGTISTGLTQPLTDTQLRAAAVPVSIASMPSTPVTGTFYQATQPVSGTVAISNPTTNPETGLAKDATLTGGTQKTKLTDGVTDVKVSTLGAVYMQGYQGAINTFNVTTASSTSGSIAVSNYNVGMISIHGTHAGINMKWEISDDGGTTWYPAQAQRDDTGAVATTSGVVTTNASVSWTIPIGAATHFKATATAWTSGTGIVGISLQSMAYEPIPSVFVQGTVPVSGTLTSAGTTTNTPVNSTTTGSFLSSAATTNLTTLKAGAGNLYSVSVSNIGAAAAYLKLYNKASNPALASDVPVLTISIPASGTINVPFGAIGLRFATGIAYAITNLAADTDATAVAAAQVKVMWSYI